MNTIRLSIIATAIFSVTAIGVMIYLFFTGFDSHEQSNETKPIDVMGTMPLEFVNMTTEPKTVTVGDTFQIYATVKNPNAWPAAYQGGCISPLTVSFDKNVQMQRQIGCMAISSETINPGEQARVHGPGTGITYNATTVGATNATITFSYKIRGGDKNITMSSRIEIEPPLPTPAQVVEQLRLGKMYVDPADPAKGIILDCKKPIGMQMKAIDESIDQKKAISLAYASPDFASEVDKYGTVRFNSIFNDWVAGEPCNTQWTGVEVVFSATDSSGLARNIQVSEDIELGRVLNVTDYASGYGG